MLAINSLRISPTVDLIKSLVATAGTSDINGIVINGKLVLKDRRFIHFDEDEIHIKVGEALLCA